MPGALIVSSGEKGRDMLCGVLTDMGAGDISTVTSGAEARRGFADADWQVILITRRCRTSSATSWPCLRPGAQGRAWCCW